MMKRKHILYTFLLLMGCSSCGDFLSEYSQDLTVPKTVYDIDEVLLGNGYMPSYDITGGPVGTRSCGFFNILDDDVNTGNSDSRITATAWVNSVFPTFGYFAWQLKVGEYFDGSGQTNDAITWNDLYARINVINVLLDEIQDLPHEIEKDYAAYLRIQGECHFLRAQFYFILANLYGDAYDPENAATKLCVPLKLTASVEHDKDKDTQFQRATVKEVYDQVVADLTVAEKLLTESPQDPSRMLYRASLEAVDLLFSRVYLYMQQWQLAEEKADAVLQSKHFSLASIGMLSGEGAFLTEDNPEVIHSQGPNNIASPRVFTGNPGDYCISKELLRLFTAGDQRVNLLDTAATDSVALGKKYNRTTVKSHISDVLTLRLSEAYLNKAEACAIQGGKEAVANELLNTLRSNRIENYASQSYSGAELVRQIRDERRKELFLEGHRWFDLRRYAVCKEYPYSKPLLHVFNRCGDWGVTATMMYVLNEHDPAYTFALPEDVINFDKVPMENNPREERKPLTNNEKE